MLMHLEIGEDKMIEKLLKDWKGEIEINDKHYTSVQDATSDFKTLSADSHIILHSATKKANMSVSEAHSDIVENVTQYRVTVKRYMTEKSTAGFDFMMKFNKDNPMPLRTMTGTIEKETKGMVYMKLHGQAEPVVRCMRCGRLLTNPISQHYGIGPECMSKLGFVCDIDDVDTIKKKLVDVVWEGWIIKSSILQKELI